MGEQGGRPVAQGVDGVVFKHSVRNDGLVTRERGEQREREIEREGERERERVRQSERGREEEGEREEER